METLEDQNKMPMTVKDWLLTFLIIAIPVVGIVMLFVYAFGNNGNVNRQNWAKAQLILLAIVIALLVLCMIVFGSIFAAAMSQ
jgi:hypothetical protein